MALATADLEFLSDVVASRSGNMISTSQGYLVESRLAPVAEAKGLASVEQLVAELRKSSMSPLHDRVAEAMTINETSFFRDPDVYTALRTTILPSLIETRRSTRKLTIWSAACSTGQEPYSVAMTLRDHFPELASWAVRIIATDYSETVLAKCREGCYSQFEVNRGLPAPMLIRHFDRTGLQWRVRQELRQMMEFRHLNLATEWPYLPPADLILLRNVLIYFDRAAKAGILMKARRVLQPDGFLLLGGGETILNLNCPFTWESIGGTVCCRPQGTKEAIAT